MNRTLRPVILAAAALSAAATTSAPARAAEIRWNADGDKTVVAVVGLPETSVERFSAIADPDRRAAVLRVSLAGSSRPILGSHRVADGRIEFVPRFRLEAGTSYDAVFAEAELIPGANPKPIKSTHQIAAPAAGPPTSLLRVDPAVDVVPENLLRMYLTFSAPMSRGQVYSRVHLLDEKEKPIDLAFLELGEELWNREQTRVTLLFDPGRIKSGLKPREDEGPILVAGRTYTLTVDPAWPDATGRPLAKGFRRTFKVGAADTTSPVPKNWRIAAPAARSRDPLTVHFGETLDHALAARLISVVDDKGETVEGETTLDDAAKVWSFKPAQPWTAGSHAVSVVPTLEDLAGNSVAKPFEVDVFQVDRPEAKSEPVRLEFRPK